MEETSRMPQTRDGLPLIGLQIKSLSHLIRHTLDALMAESGDDAATGTQGMIIHFLVEKGAVPVYQRDVEAMFRIRRATATRTLQLMEENGLLYRVQDPRDARLKRLCLTEKAIHAHNAFGDCLESCEHLLRAGIPPEEIDAFLSTLQKMKNNLEQKENHA